MIIVARLLKDLPDIKAGAVFTSITPQHHKECGFKDEWSQYRLYYFHSDKYDRSVDTYPDGLITSYIAYNIRDWCEFFDYSDRTFKPYEEVQDLFICIE